MPPRFRIASVSVASAAAIGLIVPVAIVVSPPAFAEPCQGPAAGAQPTASQNVKLPSPSARQLVPIGHKPAGANEAAPLPKLGLLPRILNALTPRSAQVQQQAAVAPTPNPRVPQQQPVPVQPAPAPAAQPAPGPDLTGPAATSIVGWVTGPDSPAKTIERFGVTGTDLGIMWDNGGGQVLVAFGDTYGF
ncbi:MAG TPA: DUF4185 domain-containing protein, partial [Gemmatimonadales bacterium]|nr:DUF4185 domain-containing protein [Gemmatimonadales bacterium]